jgi:hypothetical protein
MAKGKKKPAKKSAKKTPKKSSRKKSAPNKQVAAEVSTVGRPSKYDPLYCEQVEKLCKLGATDKELAEFFVISESTLNLWKVEHAEFSEAVKRGKILADAEVAFSFHKRATGYKYDEVTYEKIGPGEDKVEVGESGMEEIKQDLFKKKIVTKEVPPDAGAGLNWLKNRQKDKWRDKVEVETKNLNLNSEPLSKDEIKEISQALEDDC